jgi:hypothetical protein
VEIAGSHAFVASGPAGLHVYDLADPAHPVLIATCDTEGEASDVEIVGGYAYVADGYRDGLQVIDTNGRLGFRHPSVRQPRLRDGLFRRPSPPRPLHSDLPGHDRTLVGANNAGQVAVRDGIAYVADRTFGLHVVDARDPQAPRILSRLELSGTTWKAVADG